MNQQSIKIFTYEEFHKEYLDWTNVILRMSRFRRYTFIAYFFFSYCVFQGAFDSIFKLVFKPEMGAEQFVAWRVLVGFLMIMVAAGILLYLTRKLKKRWISELLVGKDDNMSRIQVKAICKIVQINQLEEGDLLSFAKIAERRHTLEMEKINVVIKMITLLVIPLSIAMVKDQIKIESGAMALISNASAELVVLGLFFIGFNVVIFLFFATEIYSVFLENSHVKLAEKIQEVSKNNFKYMKSLYQVSLPIEGDR